MSIVAGCDVGSLTTKAVILRNGRMTGCHIIRSGPRPRESAGVAMAGALGAAGLCLEEIAYCIGTGYGRDMIPFVREVRSEIACHAKGARWLLPSAQTVIDIGGQDCKAMTVDRHGNVTRFCANDKCASGTGRFLEVMAGVLGLAVDDLGRLSSLARSPVTLASTCTVWAQADVITYINSGTPLADIGAGVNTAMAQRVAVLVNSLRPEGDILMTGGVAKNAGVVSTLEKLIGLKIRKTRKADPQAAGAIGAALLAMERLEAGGRKSA